VDHVVVARAPADEIGDVGGGEIAVLAVERLEEAVGDLGRQRIVDGPVAVVLVLEDVRDAW
jgi:hypothetical protein